MSGMVIHAEEKFRLRGAIRIVNLSEADIHALFPSAPGLPLCYQRVIDMIADPFAAFCEALDRDEAVAPALRVPANQPSALPFP